MESKIWYKPTFSVKQKQIHRHREQGREWMKKGGKDWDLGIIRGKLVCIEWINNTVLPYRTGNHIQHPVTNHDGNECVCV